MKPPSRVFGPRLYRERNLFIKKYMYYWQTTSTSASKRTPTKNYNPNANTATQIRNGEHYDDHLI